MSSATNSAREHPATTSFPAPKTTLTNTVSQNTTSSGFVPAGVSDSLPLSRFHRALRITRKHDKRRCGPSRQRRRNLSATILRRNRLIPRRHHNHYHHTTPLCLSAYAQSTNPPKDKDIHKLSVDGFGTVFVEKPPEICSIDGRNRLRISL